MLDVDPDGFWAFAKGASEQQGTPYYVYLPDELATAYSRFSNALEAWGDARVAYSVKTNPLFPLLTDMRHCGAMAEVVSGWEFRHAVAAGFTAEEIVFNGPLKTEKDLGWIIREQPYTINVDSLDELDLIEKLANGAGADVRVGVRICPPKGDGPWSRFGLDLPSGELDIAIQRILASRWLKLACVHFHLGTQVEGAHRYTEMIRVVRALWARHLLGPEVKIDIGGGFPYDHSQPLSEQPFSPASFLATLATAWGPSRPSLIAEPGRILAAPAMCIVARVLSCKPRLGEPTIVVIDSGTNHNVMSAFYEHMWRYHEAVASKESHRLCGPLCMEDDILSGERQGDRPTVGSLVAAFNAGAYSLTLSRTFIQPRPAIIAWTPDAQPSLIERPEELEATYGSGRAASQADPFRPTRLGTGR